VTQPAALLYAGLAFWALGMATFAAAGITALTGAIRNYRTGRRP
jgi:hypothetical protein